MNRRTRTPIWIVASALALAGCAHPAGAGGAAPQDSGRAHFGALEGDATATPTTPDTTSTRTTNSNSNGGSGHSPSPSPSPSGPRIVTFTAKGAVCPVDAKPGAPYSSPGQVTIAWKIAGADTVDLLMDGGPYKSYPGQEGNDTLYFACDNNHGPKVVTHTYKLIIKNTNVSKTISASAHNNPN